MKEEKDAHRLRSFVVPAESPSVGRPLRELDLAGATVTALVRSGERRHSPSLDTSIETADVLVLYGPLDDLQQVERSILG